MSRKLETKVEKKPKLKAAVKEYKDPDVKEFEFGTIVLTCKCGRKQTLMEHIEHGIQFILATNDKSGLTLHCDECHSDLRLHCEEGVPPLEVKPEPEVTVPDTTDETVETVDDTTEIVEETETNEILNEDVPEESREGESV